MICWLASYPRSGNTFLRILLQSMFALESRSVYEEGENSSDSMASAFGFKGQIQDLEAIRNDPRTFLVKTHGLPDDQDDVAIYVARDGRDALVSYAHYMMRFETENVQGLTFPEVLEAVIRGELGFGDWSANVEAWYTRPAPTMILRYEDLLKRPFERILFALRQLEIDVTPTGCSPPSFEALKSQFPDFFRRGVGGGWREEMPTELADLFMQRHGEAMEALGYEGRPSKQYRPLRRAA